MTDLVHKVYPGVLICPICGDRTASEVKDSRGVADAMCIRRRRQCANGHRYTTEERPREISAPDSPRFKREAYYEAIDAALEALRRLERKPFDTLTENNSLCD